MYLSYFNLHMTDFKHLSDIKFTVTINGVYFFAIRFVETFYYGAYRDPSLYLLTYLLTLSNLQDWSHCGLEVEL